MLQPVWTGEGLWRLAALRPRWPFVALALALLLPGLGDAPYDDPGEGQHAEIAREILASGDWLTLRLNGVRYFDKPPLLYWLAAGAFAVLGDGEWAARLAPLAGAVLAAAATALLGARLLGPWAGLGAAGALLSSALFVVFGRYVRPETLFVAAIQWGLTGLPGRHGGERTAPRLAPGRGCTGLALASLAKDPLGLIGPLGASALALALGGRLGWQSARLPWGDVAVLAILGFGWYLVAALLSPGFLWYTVVDNHILYVHADGERSRRQHADVHDPQPAGVGQLRRGDGPAARLRRSPTRERLRTSRSPSPTGKWRCRCPPFTHRRDAADRESAARDLGRADDVASRRAQLTRSCRRRAIPTATR